VDAPQATARLAAVVKQCGQPEPVTLWLSPEQDKGFQRAVRENRVLSVKQETVGTSKDFGVVGFQREKKVSYWVFPKALNAFERKRIIGIDYTVLKAPPLAAPARPPARSTKTTSPRPPAAKGGPGLNSGSETAPVVPKAEVKAAPRLQRFRVVVRCTSTVEVTHISTSGSQRQAKQEALAAIKNRAVDYSQGQHRCVAVRVERFSEKAGAERKLFSRKN